MAIAAGIMLAPHGTASAAGPELSDEPIPMATEKDLPPRQAPLIEIGSELLGTGPLSQGFELPTGAVWTPALWVFGDYRTAFQYFDSGRNEPVVEWANRLDLFANLRLSGTERLLVGISPLRDGGEFSGYTFEPDEREGWNDAFDLEPTVLFFEGELGEIFPNLDPGDRGALDLGFAVGRQPLVFQEGIMINDTVDTVAVTRDGIVIPGLSVDTRLTALFGWNEVNRDDNDEDDEAEVYGLFTESDWGASTVQLDAAYVDSDRLADGLYLGAGGVRRIAILGQTVNTALRVNGSVAMGQESAAVSDGTLLFAELSTTPHGTDNVLYGNLFWGIDEYASVSRDETAGGPLGQVGILFAAVGLGEFGSALSNRADNAVGGAIGYQMFFNNERTQLIFEVGGRLGTKDEANDQAAVGARIQQAIGNRFVLRLDGFVSTQERGDEGAGLRTELVTRF